MRIAYVAPFDLKQPAGHAAHVLGTLRELVRRGEDVTLYAIDCPDDVSASLQVRRVPSLDRAGVKSLTFGLGAAALLGRNLWELPSDLVYTRYFKSVIAPMAVAKSFGCPIIVEVNSSLSNERRVSGVVGIARAVERAEENAVFGLAAGVVAVTQGVKREVLRRHPNRRLAVSVVENGVDTSLYRPRDMLACRQELGLDGAVKYAVFTGALQAWQGITDLVRAVALARCQEPSLHLLIVGDGPERASAVSLIAELGLSRHVTLTGYVSELAVAKYLSASDVCVAPYNTNAVDDAESDKKRYGAPMPRSPLKVLSYMACGRAVIATHLAEAGAYLAEADMGLAVPPEDPIALAEAIVALLRDPARARHLGDRAREAAERFHSWEVAVSAYLELARTVIR